MQLLLLAFALANAAGALAVAAVATSNPPILYAAGVAAPVAVSATWFVVYRRRSIGPVSDAVVVLCAVIATAASDVRWQTDMLAFLTAAVLFGAAYSSWRGVAARSAVFAESPSATASATTATTPRLSLRRSVCVCVFVVIAVHGPRHGPDRSADTSERPGASRSSRQWASTLSPPPT